MSSSKRLKPGERRACKCGTEIVGARTVNGKVAPIVTEPSPAGNVWLGRAAETAPVQGDDLPWEREVRCAVFGGEKLEWARGQGMALYVNHFADCPDAKEFSRG